MWPAWVGNCMQSEAMTAIKHLNSVECYDPKVSKWEYVQPMKTLRRGIAVGVLGGPMYAVGEYLQEGGRESSLNAALKSPYSWMSLTCNCTGVVQ